MKVSLSWLREFVELPVDVVALTELLTRAGVEVEGVHTRGVALDKVVVARIASHSRHPNADRLSVCQVDDGSGQPRQIVCGARNFKDGDKAPLALPGAVLPGDFRIKASKLRGVESEGMLCSAKELSLAEDSEGILILPADAPVGHPLGELFPPDTVLDLEVTPNRPDLLSHAGMAREISSLTGKPWKGLPESAPVPVNAMTPVNLAPECELYSATRISGVKVGESPAWMRQKLEAIGLRPINNIVDITNFGMFESGQPLHAFDADKLEGGMHVRFARAGEEFLALDGRAYVLEAGDLVIADDRRAVALAGVMGGEATGVTGSTTRILLESARFDPAHIRRTARRLGLHSDSSYRFERGVDPGGVVPAAERAAGLAALLAGGTVEGISVAGSVEREARRAPLRYERCDSTLGVAVGNGRIDSILSGFGLKKEGGGTWEIPSYRADLTREIDLIEEVMRVAGMEIIPSRTVARFAGSSPADLVHDRNTELRRALAGQGFFEVRTLSLGSAGARRVRNPLNEEQAFLRSDLLPGLLRVAETNARLGTKDLRLFELGRVFGAANETTHLALLMTGAVDVRSWRDARPRGIDLFDLKGALAALAAAGLGRISFGPAENPAFALSMDLFLGGNRAGVAGQLQPAQARGVGLASPIFFAEIELPPSAAPGEGSFRPVAVYPAIARDIALVVPEEASHGKIMEILWGAKEPLLESVELFDFFSDPTGEKVPAGRKSLAYSLTYRADNRTLTADEANAAHARLKELLRAGLDVQFRE